MFFSSLLIQGDFIARLTAVWADDGTPCKRFVPRSGPRIPMEKPDPMVSAHPIWWLSSAPHFFGSTLASTCPATRVFAVDVSVFFHGSCPHTFSSYPPFQPWVWCVIFLVALLGSFLQWHPWKAPVFSLNFDCVVSLSMSLKFGLCFVFMPMLCVCGSSSSFLSFFFVLLWFCCCCQW